MFILLIGLFCLYIYFVDMFLLFICLFGCSEVAVFCNSVPFRSKYQQVGSKPRLVDDFLDHYHHHHYQLYHY